jgi:hypothetical protein
MMNVLSHLRTVNFPPIEQRRHVPSEVAAFLARATAHDRSARFASWVDLAGALDDIRASLPHVGPRELLQALPLRPPPPPTIDPRTLANWRALPHDGLVPVDAKAVPLTRLQRVRGAVAPDFIYPPNTDGRPMLAVGNLLVDVQPFIDEAVALGVEQLSFTGGEPFIVKDFVAILAYASERRPCLVLTNGTDPVLKRLHQIETLIHQRHLVRGVLQQIDVFNAVALA